MNKFFQKTLILLAVLMCLVAFSSHSRGAETAKPSDEANLVSDEPVQEEKSPTPLELLIKGKKRLKISGYHIELKRVLKIYNSFENKLLWLNENNDIGEFDEAIDFISKADENGFFQKDFDVEKIKSLIESAEEDEEFRDNNLQNEIHPKVIKADILTTHLVSKLILDIANGKPVPKVLKAEIYPKTRIVRIPDINAKFVEFLAVDNVEDFILSISPRNDQYHLLKKALIDLNLEREEIKFSDKIPLKGPNIIVGMRDYRVPVIRKKLGLRKAINPAKAKAEDLYDKDLMAAIVEYQKQFDLKEDGVIGKRTIRALNISLNEIENKIKANMERYRWVKDEVPPTRIEVNIPQFILKTFADNQKVEQHSIIVGRKKKKSALMNTKLYSIILNPFWHVPYNYAIKQMLPILQTDENYLRDQEFDVFEKDENRKWAKVDHSEIDWNLVDKDNFDYLLRQRPGKKNALGPIKFNIKNPFAIYLHSTTEPWLFSNKYKAYSSGCIRVENPDKLAKWLLENNTKFKMERFDEIYNAFDNKNPEAKKPKAYEIKLNEPMPIVINYFTVEVVDGGELKFYKDIYDWDSGIIKGWSGL